MLWLKTLRDLLLSVPAAHANGRGSTSSSKAAAVVWTVVAILGLVFLLNSLVLPSMISRMPRTDEAALATAPAIVAPEQLGPTGEYRTVARVAAAGISTLLAFGALLFALRQPRVLNGLAPFVAGGALTFIALAMNPWIWLPLDRYPVAIVWALGIWPLAAAAWAALRIAARRSHRSV